MTVTSEAPWIGAAIVPGAGGHAAIDHDQVVVAELTITLDTSKAPQRVHDDVVVRAGSCEIRIPVLAYVTKAERAQGVNHE